MRLPAVKVTLQIGSRERSWYSAGHDALLQWNQKERDRYLVWVRQLPTHATRPLSPATRRVLRRLVCEPYGHTWEWHDPDATGPTCTLCHNTTTEDP